MFSPTSVLAFATALLPITVIIFFSECVIAHLFLDFRGLVLRRHVSIFCFCEFFLWLVPQACGEGVRFCKFLLLAGVHAERKSKSIQLCNEFGRWTLYRYLTSNLSCYDSASPSSKQVSHLLCVSDESGSNGPWPNPMILGELAF